jgi:hypothetical protein
MVLEIVEAGRCAQKVETAERRVELGLARNAQDRLSHAAA